MEENNSINMAMAEEKKPIKIKKSTIWKTVSAVLFVLLVFSIFTNGFKFDQDPTGRVVIDLDDFSAILINDERCKECDPTSLIGQLNNVFPNVEIIEYDYSSKEGKEIYDENELTVLPAVLFTEAVKDTEGYTQVERYLDPKGDYLSLRIGSNFDPSSEICDNDIDDNGDGDIDCDDANCEGSLLCREEIPQKLDLFVMSQCPYGTKALDAMQEVLSNFGDDIDFDIHFIANENPDGSFKSLHGQPEVDENIRELCAIKYYPDNYQYMDYIWCRDKNIQSAEWEGCAVEAFGTSEKIKECFEDEGQKLHSDDIKIANQLQISASPTWLANNQVKFSGIDSETARRNFCNSNPSVDGCDSTLSTDTAVGGSC